jgi:fucose permease
MEMKRPVITAGAFAALAFNGMTFAFIGTTLPAMRDFMGINVALAGTLMATLQTGFTLLTLAGGLMSDLMRRERVLLLGCLFLSTGAFLLGRWPAIGVNLLLFLCLGMGAGLVLSGSNALLVGLFPAHKGTILNTHHVFFGLGSLVGPLLMGWLLQKGSWIIGYRGLAVATALLAVVFLVSNTSDVIRLERRNFGNQVGGLFTSPLYLLLVGVSALAVGVQLALMLLAVLFLTEAKDLPISHASTALSLFFVFLVLGRLICSRLASRLGNARITLFLLVLQAASLLGAWLGSEKAALVFIVLAGLACSAIYPSLLALTSLMFKTVEGSALGILSTLAGLGSIGICWLNGLVSQRTNVAFGFCVLVGASCMAFVLFALNYRRVHDEETAITGGARTGTN